MGLSRCYNEATLAEPDRANAKFKLGLEWQMMDATRTATLGGKLGTRAFAKQVVALPA